LATSPERSDGSFAQYTASVLDLTKHPFLAALLWGLLFSLLFALAFPPANLWPLAFAAPMPLVWIAARTSRPFRSALGVYLASIPMWAFLHAYIWDISAAGVFPLVLYLSLWPALFVWLTGLVQRRVPRFPVVFVAPLIWTGLEVLRGEVVWHGYPWYVIGHPLIGAWPIDGCTTYLGTYGVSFTVVMLATAVLQIPYAVAAHKRSGAKQPFRLRGLAPELFAFTLAVLIAAAPIAGRSVAALPIARIAVIQTNVPQDNKIAWTVEQRMRDFARMLALTRQAAATTPPPDLIVWPETMFPGYALNETAIAAERAAGLSYRDGRKTTYFHAELLLTQREIGIPMIVGAMASDGLSFSQDDAGGVRFFERARYNSAFLIHNGAVAANRYDKIHLTPFGEVMPYISSWPWLERQLLSLGARGMAFDLSAGTTMQRFEVPVTGRAGHEATTMRIAAPICFEITVSGLCRRLVWENGERRADLLLNLSNDGWLGNSDGSRRAIVQQSRWRAVELATPVVRAVNTGISVAIDQHGRITSSLPPREDGVLIAEVPLLAAGRVDHGATPYARWGNVFGWFCLCAASGLVAVALAMPRPRTSRRGLAAG